MRQLHIHPDKKVFLRDENEVLFEGSIEEAEAFLGELPPMPEGVNEIQLNLEDGEVAAFGKCGKVDGVCWSPKSLKGLGEMKKAGALRKQALVDAAYSEPGEEPIPKSPEDEEHEKKERNAFVDLFNEVAAIADSEPDKDSLNQLRQDLRKVAALLRKVAV